MQAIPDKNYETQPNEWKKRMNGKRRLQRRIRRVTATGPTKKLWKNALERVQPAVAVATHQVVIKERRTTKTEQQMCLDQWRCVLCNDSCKVGFATARARRGR